MSFKLLTEGISLLPESLPKKSGCSLTSVTWTQKIPMPTEIFCSTGGVIKIAVKCHFLPVQEENKGH